MVLGGILVQIHPMDASGPLGSHQADGLGANSGVVSMRERTPMALFPRSLDRQCNPGNCCRQALTIHRTG